MLVNILRNRFYYRSRQLLTIIKCQIIYPGIKYYNQNFKNKLKNKKYIIFMENLTDAKGYNLFGYSAINILKKYKDLEM